MEKRPFCKLSEMKQVTAGERLQPSPTWILYHHDVTWQTKILLFCTSKQNTLAIVLARAERKIHPQPELRVELLFICSFIQSLMKSQFGNNSVPKNRTQNNRDTDKYNNQFQTELLNCLMWSFLNCTVEDAIWPSSILHYNKQALLHTEVIKWPNSPLV